MSEQPLAIIDNFRDAYRVLERNVNRTLRTQRGAVTQINFQVNEALNFVASLDLHRASFPTTEFATIQQSISNMLALLEEARHLSSDPPTGASLIVTTQVSTGGRPRIEIDPAFLSHALTLRGPTHLRAIFGGASARTIRRRALEYGLVEPGQPVYTDTPQPDGSVSRTYTSTSAPVSTITDDELDFMLTEIL
ncbi:hypothetical protein B0H14DRAFT_3494403 [Mycena olivaceomarginata]|nr:hypothetical protein B0H14DRAFT_3494403 [Mycena olivaceomarginata]